MTETAITLTKDQQKAMAEILASIDRGENHVLKGYAGTGKSTLLHHMFKDKLERVAFCTPTNAAAKVLRNMGVQNVSTIYQLLKLAFEKGNLFQYAEPNFDDLDLIIVDECSMVSSYIMSLLDKYVTDTPILFVGDPAQLPPVKETLSQSFKTPHQSVLKEIVRQAEGNPIIEYSMAIRKNGFNNLKVPFDGKNIIKIPKNKFFDAALSAYKTGGVVAAYRNKTVNFVNNKIHKMIYGDNATDFCVGEEIILAEPLLDLYDGSVIATNGDRMTIHTLEATKFRGFESWKIEAYDEFNHLYNIIALQEKEKDKFYEALQRYHKAGDNFGYWKLKESFLDIRLPYAVTCHKLQGSTFNRVLICGEDIMAVWEKDTRAKCAYVAVTRATEKIGFLE